MKNSHINFLFCITLAWPAIRFCAIILHVYITSPQLFYPVLSKEVIELMLATVLKFGGASSLTPILHLQ